MVDFLDEMAAPPEVLSKDFVVMKSKRKKNPYANETKYHNKIQDNEMLETLHCNEKEDYSSDVHDEQPLRTDYGIFHEDLNNEENDILSNGNHDESDLIVPRRYKSQNEKHQEHSHTDLTPVQEVETEISDICFLDEMAAPPEVLPKDFIVMNSKRKKNPYANETKFHNKIQDNEMLETLHCNEKEDYSSEIHDKQLLQSDDEVSHEELGSKEEDILSNDNHDESNSVVSKKQKPKNKKQQENSLLDVTPIQKSALTFKSVKPEILNLSSLEKKMLCCLTIIRHNNELYYYNDRCYVLIRDGKHLMELYRQYISIDIENLKSPRIFDSLYVYMISNPMLTPEKYEERLKESKTLITMSNGILDLKNLELYPFDRKYLTFHELDASYVEEKSSAFKMFLNSSSGHDIQIKKRIKEVLGYLFSSNNDAKMFFVMGTAPDSGKSTIASFIEKVIGFNFIANIPPQDLGQRFALGTISGVSVNLAMDVSDGKLSPQAVSILKSITGKDRIRTERKFSDPKYHESNTRFLFGTNYPIKLSKSHNENAFWNRMLIIPFMISISDSEKDPNLIDNLFAERDAIVSQCLRAYSDVFHNGNRFSVCEAADRMKEEWRTDRASYLSVNSFWNEKVVITGSDKDFIPSTGLYQAYIEFCEKQRYESLAHKLMVAWIKENVNTSLCRNIKRRINGSDSNAVHGFTGVKFRYKE